MLREDAADSIAEFCRKKAQSAQKNKRAVRWLHGLFLRSLTNEAAAFDLLNEENFAPFAPFRGRSRAAGNDCLLATLGRFPF
jgi:hypothetical protein